jgi:DNA replication protein DnaC
MSPATAPPAPNRATRPAPAVPAARTARARNVAPGHDPLDSSIDEACRTLHLPTIRDGYDESADRALRDRLTYKEFLADLLGSEVAHRDERRKLRMVREANFPRPKRVEDFDYTANPNVAPEQVNTLSDPAWVTAGHPLCLIGDSGTGKSHLLIGIGTAIAEAGLKVRYTTAANLVNELSEAADERQLTKVIARYGRVDLLCLDEFGYLDLDKLGSKLLFQIFTDREERRSIAVASNAPFSEWKKTFTDPRLCTAVVDRLTYKAHIVETGTDSYRLLSATNERP